MQAKEKRAAKAKAKVKKAKRRCGENFGKEINENQDSNNRKFQNTLRSLKGKKRKEVRGIINKNKKLKSNTVEVLEISKELYVNMITGVNTNGRYHRVKTKENMNMVKRTKYNLTEWKNQYRG